MSKQTKNQNLKLLQAIHTQIEFLKIFNLEQLTELITKAHFFVFMQSTILALEKQAIDFIGVILEGKVSVTGQSQKKVSGYFFGELGYFGLLEKHAVTITGDSDGIILAIRLQDIPKLRKDIKNLINTYILQKCLHTLKNIQIQQKQIQQVQQKKISNLLSPQVKSFFNQQLDQKQKQLLFKFFPIQLHTIKSKIISKTQQPYLLFVIQGQLIIKHTNQLQKTSITKLVAGQFYNIQGYLLNYSTHVNIYCLSQQAIVWKLYRMQAINLLQLQTVQKIDSYFLRKQINDKKYQIMTSERRREKQKQGVKSNKIVVFSKSNYQILPLVIPRKNNQKDKDKSRNMGDGKKQAKQSFKSTLFRQQQKAQKNLKTNSSINSKLNKMITMKTQKVQQKMNNSQQKTQDIHKQIQLLNSKVKYYEENYNKCKFEMIQYQAKYKMNAVLKQINQMGDKKYRNKGGDNVQVMTLKKAFEQHMKENKIMEVVAKCAYKWLWAVRRKKGLSKFRAKK